ncbi:MAG: hypothetical protein LWX07_00775, partial [Bacteroidetes bacterium]|nr:hypothetical protein [Bacteroidota bacterium]
TVELKSEGASPEFKVTAILESVSDKGTMLEIECSGGDYALGGEKRKELSSAGSATWSLTIPKPETIITVKITRLDTKSCKTILVGGKIEAKDLVGEWDGGTCWDSWSTPIKMAEKKIKDAMLTGKGEFLPMSMTVTLVSENEIYAKMSTKGGTMPPPPLNFKFNDGNLEASTTYMMTKYHFTGTVKPDGGNYTITGEWSGSNFGLSMNGRWKATKPIKKN